MWRNEAQKPRRADCEGDGERNRRALTAVALVIALVLALASPLPTPLVPVALESFMFYGAFGAAILAVFRGDHIRARHLTAWDQALMLLFMSQLAGFFVDAEAVHEVMDAHGIR